MFRLHLVGPFGCSGEKISPVRSVVPSIKEKRPTLQAMVKKDDVHLYAPDNPTSIKPALVCSWNVDITSH